MGQAGLSVQSCFSGGWVSLSCLPACLFGRDASGLLAMRTTDLICVSARAASCLSFNLGRLLCSSAKAQVCVCVCECWEMRSIDGSASGGGKGTGGRAEGRAEADDEKSYPGTELRAAV